MFLVQILEYLTSKDSAQLGLYPARRRLHHVASQRKLFGSVEVAPLSGVRSNFDFLNFFNKKFKKKKKKNSQ